VYGWIWARLPGGPGAKAVSAAVLAVALAALLWFWAFPWLSLHLPLDQASVSG
jgi:hypothetical protein